MGIISGLKLTCPEITVMLENNTVLPEDWLVSLFDLFPSFLLPPAFCSYQQILLRYISAQLCAQSVFGVNHHLPIDYAFLQSIRPNVYTSACLQLMHVYTSDKCSLPKIFSWIFHNICTE